MDFGAFVKLNPVPCFFIIYLIGLEVHLILNDQDSAKLTAVGHCLLLSLALTRLIKKPNLIYRINLNRIRFFKPFIFCEAFIEITPVLPEIFPYIFAPQNKCIKKNYFVKRIPIFIHTLF